MEDRIVIDHRTTVVFHQNGISKPAYFNQVLAALAHEPLTIGHPSTLFPLGTVAYMKSNYKEIFAIQDEPKVRQIKWTITDPSGVKNTKVYTVRTPWVVYILGLSNGRMLEGWGKIFFSYESIKSLDDPLLFTPLSMTGGTYASNELYKGYICFGSSTQQGGMSPVLGSTPHEKLNTALRNVWATNFYQHDEATDVINEPNRQQYVAYHEPVPPSLVRIAPLTMAEWADGCKKDKNFSLKFQWKSASITVSEAMRALRSKIDHDGTEYRVSVVKDFDPLCMTLFRSSCG